MHSIIITNSHFLFTTLFATTVGKIFVGGLSWQTTEESLRWHFEQFGAVASVSVMKDRNTGNPRGFAFVVFENPETVDAVMAESAHEINHKVVDVKRAQARGVAPPSIHREEGDGDGQMQTNAPSSSTVRLPQQQQQQQQHMNNFHDNNNNQDESGLTPEQLHNKVFVGGLPASVDRDELKVIFEQFGPVVDAIVMVDQGAFCFLQ